MQIRSRLQDAWAELSHDDIYKQPNLPEDLRARAKDLAEVLAAADKIASDIRSRVMRETASPAHRPDLGHVSAEGLAYSFREVFGRSPPDYAVRLALNLCNLSVANSYSRGDREFEKATAMVFPSKVFIDLNEHAGPIVGRIIGAWKEL